ncbi:unnamed protein product [Closterium sp. NIES-54]
MHSRLLVSGLLRSLPPLPPSLAPPCFPCVEGRQRGAPHSSSFPPTTAPLQTLHMDVWRPVHLRERSREDLPVLRLHSDRGGEFSSEVLELLLELEVPEVLELLVLEVLVLGVSELPGLLVLEELELEALELEALELKAMALAALELEELEPEALALEALELEALVLEAMALVALELEELERRP